MQTVLDCILRVRLLVQKRMTNKKIKDTMTLSQGDTIMQTTFTNAGTVPEMEERITSVLKTCYDPEIPVDIFELGLIYTVAIDAENNVQVEMTLTSPNCPAAGTLPGEVEQRLADIPDVKSCLVDVVFDPPWERSNMSEVAMLELGFM